MPDVEITCRNHGPLRVSGDFVIRDAEGNEYDLSGRRMISLCRCGHSENKPFCDGSHRQAGFQSEVKAKTLPLPGKS
ncbi:MAG: CDGSH iron-sulfur domain-containing protein [Acidobacteriota bacterium]